MFVVYNVKVLEVPIISQVWDLLETPQDQLTNQSSKTRRSSSSSSDGATSAADGGRRLSLKKFFQQRSSKAATRQTQSLEDQQIATTSLNEPNADDTSLMTDYVVAGIPSTEVDLVNYIVAHGILSKELR